MGSVAGPLAFVFVPETYKPVLQARAAAKARARNPDAEGHPLTTPQDSITLHDFVHKFLLKPAIMLTCEPMVSSIPFPRLRTHRLTHPSSS